jgi:ribosomal protein S16
MLKMIPKTRFVTSRKKRFYANCFFAFLLFSIVTPFASAQESIADLIIRIKPSVAKIVVYDAQGKQIATGSGFFISQTKAITNKHVVVGAKTIEIKTFDGSVIYANAIQNVSGIDIAVLEFSSSGKTIKPLLIAANSPREGDRIVVFGSPLGLEGSVSDGIVSATRKIAKGEYLQITAPISPGSSGSPVLDMSGRVVGVATLNIEGGQNLNFAIPAQQVASLWVNQISNDLVKTNNSSKQETVKQPIIDLTGNWKSLTSTARYQIIDDGKKVSFTSFQNGVNQNDTDDSDAKWVGDVVIGYYNGGFKSLRNHSIFKVIDSETIHRWIVAGLKVTDSDEKLLRKLIKETKGKPDDVLKRTH